MSTVVKLTNVEKAVVEIVRDKGVPDKAVESYHPPFKVNSGCLSDKHKTPSAIIVASGFIALILCLSLVLSLRGTSPTPTQTAFCPLFGFQIAIEDIQCDDGDAVETAKNAYKRSVARTLVLDKDLITVTAACVSRKKLLRRLVVAAPENLTLDFVAKALGQEEANRIDSKLKDSNRVVSQLVAELTHEGVVVKERDIALLYSPAMSAT